MHVFFYASGFLRAFSTLMCTAVFAKDYSKYLADQCPLEHTFEERFSIVTLHVSWSLPLHQISLFAKMRGLNIKAAPGWERRGEEITEPCCLSVIFWNARAWMASLPSQLFFFSSKNKKQGLSNKQNCLCTDAGTVVLSCSEARAWIKGEGPHRRK